MGALSPMMRQYLELKEKNKDCILFFRLGDFYEMFFDDAKLASEELDLVLTGRDCGLEERAPMCGVPFHSCESYIARLVKKGYKIAICEQMEAPQSAKGLVKRDVVRVITPGTVIEDAMLDESKNNFLSALFFKDKTCGICFADVSTGSIFLTEVSNADYEQKALCEIARFKPKEIVVCKKDSENKELQAFLNYKLDANITIAEDTMFSDDMVKEVILKHFKQPLEDKGILPGSAMATALGSLIGYLNKTQLLGVGGLCELKIYSDSQFMSLDITAMRNLELCESMRIKEKKGTLLWVLDKTKTSMGKRLIRRFVEQPLTSVTDITSRHNAVDELLGNLVVRSELIALLSGVHDIERLMARITYATASGRELRSLSSAMGKLPSIKQITGGLSSRLLKEIDIGIDPLEDVKAFIDSAIVDEPPVSIRDGGIIREGYNSDVDTLRLDMTDGKSFIARIEAQERERTGIKNLKIRYNRVFGYYIEVTNSYADKIPAEYIRKQTLTNCERYITDELKTLEARILGARERVTQIEFEIFDSVRRDVAAQFERIRKTAESIALLDVLCSLARVAADNSYCRPQINTTGRLNITKGRHPVVELLTESLFVPNDSTLDLKENRCAIITGPNMAGKSTYMRQVALIVIMAQLGSFVPASSADICIVDAVFTRVGASDDLASGKSTFMVEMSEVADILKNATKNSLLILDEIGRGTSTYDGMSIARSVLEFTADRKCLGAKTLFATHYHELTALEGQIDGVQNYNIAVKKDGDDITFLRRIVRGGADDSYGIEVAKLSGIPDDVISRAKEILYQLEQEKGIVATPRVSAEFDSQITLEMSKSSQLLNEIKMIDINTLSPIEALTILHEFVKKAKLV